MYTYAFYINLEPVMLGVSEKADGTVVDHCSPITCIQLQLTVLRVSCV